MDSKVNIGVIQRNPIIGVENIERNINESIAWIKKAKQKGSELIVFPELNDTGYVFKDRKEAFEIGKKIKEMDTLSIWKDIAKQENVYLATSYVELEDNKLYDTSALIGPNGLVGTYRKTHLWNREKIYFTPGDEGFPVFNTELGRIGMLICWDIWFPETFRILSSQGADLVLTLNNWVYTPGPLFDETGRCMPVYHTMSASQSNGIVIAASNRVGNERGATFLGNSLITGVNGWEIERLNNKDEGMICQEVDLSNSRKKHWTEFNSLLQDRRTDLYDPLLGYTKGNAYPR